MLRRQSRLAAMCEPTVPWFREGLKSEACNGDQMLGCPRGVGIISPSAHWPPRVRRPHIGLSFPASDFKRRRDARRPRSDCWPQSPASEYPIAVSGCRFRHPTSDVRHQTSAGGLKSEAGNGDQMLGCPRGVGIISPSAHWPPESGVRISDCRFWPPTSSADGMPDARGRTAGPHESGVRISDCRFRPPTSSPDGMPDARGRTAGPHESGVQISGCRFRPPTSSADGMPNDKGRTAVCRQSTAGPPAVVPRPRAASCSQDRPVDHLRKAATESERGSATNIIGERAEQRHRARERQ